MTTTRKKLQREYKCILCNNQYSAVRYVADKKKRFCSTSCRDLAGRIKKRDAESKKVARRLVKLPTSEFFLWISRECKRAGSVEVLHGHTPTTLEQLQDFYLYRRKCYGYNQETKTSRWHACHIAPAVGKDSIGLLHPANLFVGDAFRNQKLGNNVAQGAGLSLPHPQLKSEWQVDSKDSDRKVLDKVSRYLGNTLRTYAANNPIDKSARFVLIDWILLNQAGHFDVPYSHSDLIHKSTDDLRKIRCDIEDKPHYQHKLPSAKRSILVYFDEMLRLSAHLPEGRHKDDCTWLVDVMRIAGMLIRLQPSYVYDNTLDNILAVLPAVDYKPLLLAESMKWGGDVDKSLSKFRDFINFTAYETLQGFPLDRSKVRNTLRKYVVVNELSPDYTKLEEDLFTGDLYEDQVSSHKEQVKSLLQSLQALQMVEDITAAPVLDNLSNIYQAPARVVQELPWHHTQTTTWTPPDGWLPF